MEVLKSTNILLEQCPTAAKEHFLGSEELVMKISELVNLVKTIGDYEFQVGLIECLMRLFPRKSRQVYAKKFFSDPHMLDGFLAIKDKDFETDCRLFLNSVNAKAEDPSKGVFSLPCVTAFVGSKQLRKPSDAGYEEFWVDFNFGSERLTLFCEQDSIYSQSTFDEELWETVAIYKTDVQQCTYNELPGQLELEVSLKHPVCDLYPSQHQDVQDNKIKIHFNPELEAHVTHAVGYTFDFSERRCKTSTVQTPLQISLKEVKQVDSQSESMYDCPLPNPPSPVRSGSQESVSRKRKVSIPTVPMQNPAASPMLKPDTPAQKYIPSENASVADSQPKPQTNKAADRFLKVSESIKEITGKKNSQINQSEKHVESKKDFAVPTTPVKKTRSRVKVKTPVVTVTPPAKKSKESTVVAKTSEKENNCNHTDVCEPDVVIPDSLPPVEEITEVYTAKKVKASKSADHLDDSGIGIDESRSTINNTSVTSELDHCDQPNVQKEDLDLTGATKVVDNMMVMEKKKKLTRDKNKDQSKDHFSESAEVCKKDDTNNTSRICGVNNFKKTASEHKSVEDHSFGFESLCVDGTVDSIPDSYESEQAMNNPAMTDQNSKLDISDCNNENTVTKKTRSKTSKKTKTEKQVKNKISTKEVSDKNQMVKTKDTPEIASATEHGANKRTFTDVDQSLRELCDLEDKENSGECNNNIDTVKIRQRRDTGRKDLPKDKILNDSVDIYKFSEPDPDFDARCNSIQGKKMTKTNKKEEGTKLPKNNRKIEMIEKQEDKKTKLQKTTSKNATKTEKRIIEETSSRDQADDVSVGKGRRKSLRTRDKNINYSEEDDFSKNDSTSSTDKRKENSTQPVLPKNATTPENSPAKSEVIACKLKSSLKKMKQTGIKEAQERSKSRVSFDLPNSESQDDFENTSPEQVEIKHNKFGQGDIDADNLSNTKIIQEITESLEVQNTSISDVEHNKTQLVNKSDKTAELSRSEEPHSPISEDSVNSDSLYIESDDSYNARRFKMEVGHWSKPKKKRESSVRKKEREIKSKKNRLQKETDLSDTLSKQELSKQENNNSISHDTSDDEKNRSCRKSNNKGKRNQKFKNIPKVSSEDSDQDSSPKKTDLQLVPVYDSKDNEKPKNKKYKPGKEKEHDLSFSVEQSFECMEHEDGLSVSQQKIKTVSEAKGKNMIFQMSYTKSQTNVKRNIGRKYGDMFVKAAPAYDPYDFEAQCDNASMASERVGRNDISKELNKKHKKSDKKMNNNNNRSIEYDSIGDDMDEHLPTYLDKKSKNKSTEEENKSSRNKKLEKTRYFNDSDDNHTCSEEMSKSEKGKHNTEDEITSCENGSFGYDVLIQNYADDHSSTDIDKKSKKKSKKKSDKSSYLNDCLVHDSKYPEEMSKAEVNQKTKRSRKSTPNQYCDNVDSSFSDEHSQEISIDEVKQSKTKTTENKLTSLVQDKRTNKWYRVKDKPDDIICTEDKNEKRSTKQKVNRTIEDDSIRSPSSSGEGAKEIEHNAESLDESFENYTLKNFSIILQDIVSGRGRLDKSLNISAIDQSDDTEIKTPCITGSVSSTPKIGSARRKHYNPLNISVIKTPQSARSLQSDSDAEKELKRNKQEKKKNRKKKSDNYRDHSVSDEDYVEDDGCNERSSKLSIDSLSLLDSSRNETSKSEKSWILERKKMPRIKKSAKTYKTNKTVKGIIETDSQTEESMDEECIKQLQPNAKPVWQKDNLSLIDTPLTIPSLSVNTPAVTPSLKSARIFQDAEDLIETPASPKKNARKKHSDEDDIEVEQTQESYNVSLNMSCCDSDNEDDDIRNLSLSGFKMKTPQKFIQDDDEDDADDEQLSVHKMLQQNMKLLLGDSGFASGPSSTVRPSRSALKRKYPDIDETIHIESSSSSQAESDEEINTSTFVPKKLFKFDPAVPLTPQAPSLYSDVTEDTELDLGFQSGLATFMAAFGADIQNQLKQRKQRIEVMTKKTLKESQKHFSQTLVEQHQYQANLIDDFEAKMVVELMALEKDIQMLAESEQKMEDYYKFQFEVLRQNEESQKKRLENLRKLQASYLDKTRKVNKYNLNIHQNLQEQLKKDMLALQKRLIIDTQKQEFMNVKRGLQNLF